MTSIPSSQWNQQVPRKDQREPSDGNPFWQVIKRLGNEMRSRQGEFENLISGAATSQDAKNLKRRMARRFVREGYPKISPFQTLEEVQNYMKGSPDGHTCLICGNSYRAVGIHLAKMHAIDPVDYLDAYGLPRTFGLSCEETKQLHRDALLETLDSGKWQVMGTPQQAKIARKAKTQSSETPYKQLSNLARVTKFNDEDFCRIISLMKEKLLTPDEVINLHPGLPSYSSFRKWRAADSARRSAFSEAVDLLPFHKQAKIKMLGQKFDLEIIRLRKEGKTIDEISDVVKLDRVSINARLKKLIPDHKQLKPQAKTHCPAGHEYKIFTSGSGQKLLRCQQCDTERKRQQRAQKVDKLI